jgi:spermidine/putrescine transport system permease protein
MGTANFVQFAAISAPDIVLASSLLSFFVTLRVPLGLPTIIVAHIMFCLSFGAGPWATFPLWIWSATRNGLPPQVDVLGTLIFAAGLVIAATSALLSRRGAR